eukprot:CAMPEP_0119315926 /NCGR_PEP_ID=MMETSP1333-20130426/37773_1 /TAXON_ID=418940 /ORGANISM="Scyphosphaera apsteinii, Strain RCC1455" /LENGTH=161 /DNA_ID=CAMNT_0007321429 /DNA_START=20 /DNA_END=502 /DNA_ORIENTATION=+
MSLLKSTTTKSSSSSDNPSQHLQSSHDDQCGENSAKRRCTFGDVEIWTHERQLDGSKLPTDGRVPLGLGVLQSHALRHVESYEPERASRRTGVRRIPVNERQEAAAAFNRTESIEAVEAEIAAISADRKRNLWDCVGHECPSEHQQCEGDSHHASTACAMS